MYEGVIGASLIICFGSSLVQAFAKEIAWSKALTYKVKFVEGTVHGGPTRL